MNKRQIILKAQFAAAALAVPLSAYFLFAGSGDRFMPLCLAGSIAGLLLLVLAFRYPSNPLSLVFAITGAVTADFIILYLPPYELWEGGQSAISGPAEYLLGPLITLHRVAALICLVAFPFLNAGEIKKRQDQRRQTMQKKAAEENDTLLLQKALADFLRPDITFEVFLNVWVFAAAAVMIPVLKKEWAEEGTGFQIMILVIFAGNIIFSGWMLLGNILGPRRYIRRLSESGELSLMAGDFAGGEKLPEYDLVLGQTYLFRRGSGYVYRYRDILEIYHEWSDSVGAHRSPYWRIYMKTADNKNPLLVSLPFVRTPDNYFDKVLPMLLEIRSRNEQIIISPLKSFRQ